MQPDETTPEATTAQVNTITPALSKDVSFTEKVQAVDNALKSRSAAQKDLKVKWAAVIKAFAEYDVHVSARRGDAVQAQNYVYNIEVLEPKNPLLNDKDMVKLASESGNLFRNFTESGKLVRVVEEKFPGFTAFANTVAETSEARYESKHIDKDATKTARAAVQPVVDEYIKAIEAYDETVESVANVKEYIAVVKDVAEISAIAQGAVAPQK